jgi:RNA polymerase sigma-70 factor (ECF subfamily)
MDDPPPLVAAYLRKRDELVRFFTLRTRSAAAAEDLVQDVYLKIQASEPPHDLQSPEAYLYRIGTNLLLDRAKQQRRQDAREASWVRATVGGDGGEPAAEEPPVDEAVASRERLARLVAAVGRLPPQVATAFRLHKFDGLSHKQVAERLGVSRSAVEKYLMSALRTLQAELDE